MNERIIHDEVIGVTSENQAMELCEAGRFREAWTALEGLDPDRHPLAFGIVETANGSQERAKDFLSRALREGAGEKAKFHLASSYWRSGELQECRAILSEMADSFEVLLLKAIIVSDLDPHEGLSILKRAARYQVSAGLQARLHNQRAILLRRIGESDRAFQEYDAAIHYFEEAKSDCVPCVINNVVSVYVDCGEYERAHTYIDKAIEMLRAEPDNLAKAYDQKARIYVAEKRIDEAEGYARLAVRTVAASDKKAWVAECLLTHSTVLILKGEPARALLEAERAEAIGVSLGDRQIIFEACSKKKEIAEKLLRDSEIQRIESALILTNQSLKLAAKKLGFNSHQVLKNVMKRHGLKPPERRVSTIPR